MHKRHPVTRLWVCVEELKFSASVETCELDAYETILMVSCKGKQPRPNQPLGLGPPCGRGGLA